MIMKVIGKRVSKYPKSAIAIIIAITIFAIFSIQIFSIEQDFSEESFMPDMDIVKASKEISEKFTSTGSISILVKSNDNNILTTENLVEMLKIENSIINKLVNENTGINAESQSVNINSVADIIAQTALFPTGNLNPTIDEKISMIQSMNDEDLKQTVSGLFDSDQTSPEILGMFTVFLTKDFNPDNGDFSAKGTLIIITLDTWMVTQAEKDIDEVVKNSELKATEMTVMGESIIMKEILDANNESMAILLPLAFGLVIVILALIYRNGLDMLFSILALGFAIIWVYGFGAAMGYSFNPMTTAVPVLIVGLGIDYGIHITMRYREELKSNKNIEKAITITILSVGMALLLATVTTVVSFLSNLVSPISLLAEFGILSAIGIIGSFITMTTFVPAVKQIRDNRRLKKGKFVGFGKNNILNNKNKRLKGAGVKVLDKAMGSGATAAEHHPICVILVVSFVTIGSLGLALHLDTTFDFNDFLPNDLDITKDIDYLMNEFDIAGGEGEEVNILINGDITDPELLRGINNTINNMLDDESIIDDEFTKKPKVESVLSLLKDWATNTPEYSQDFYDSKFQKMYNNIIDDDGIPKTITTKSDIAGLYNWFYSNPNSTKTSKSLQNFVHRTNDNNYDGTVMRISVQLDSENSEEIDILYDNLNEYKEPLDDTTDKTIVTGGPILTRIIMDSLNESQIRSMIITIFLSVIVLTIVFWFKWRSLILGLITITPVIFCVAWTLGTMYIVNIPLNMMTITIASLTIGLGITYGIHITHRFMEDLENYNSKNHIESEKKVRCPSCGNITSCSGKPGEVVRVTCLACGSKGKVTFKQSIKSLTFIDDACRSTVTHTGTALFGAASTTIAGFGLLVFALMPPLQQFGAITALTILFSFLSSVFVLPTFLVIWAKWRQKHIKNIK